jgi:hypothetical protein
MNTNIKTTVSDKSRHAPPKAGAMIEALRGLGYSTSTALADVIDNSIAAKADQVDIKFSWKGAASTITVLDNGSGMDSKELDSAMRLGEKNPLDIRLAHDLGRFGLGLKTASFSQCRSLTVASKKNDEIDCLRWDLDILATTNDWQLLEGSSNESVGFIEPLKSCEKGTIVLWERLDRIVTPRFTEQDFLDLIDKVEMHLAMVFHRYLEGRSARLILTINGRSIAPWDPFLANNTSTWSSPVEHIATEGGGISVQCFVLPHKDRIGVREHEIAGGTDGWTAQQGFYVYRNERLLVAGNWLGLGVGRSWTKEEAYRLARIRMDIPNTADAEWKIDIRKSIARPPVAIRDKLTRLAEDTRERARRVFAHRGQPVRTSVGGELLHAWQAEHFKGGIRYRIDIDHPAVRNVLEEAGNLGPQIKAMLKIIEATIPVQRIWLDTTESKETPSTGFSGEPSADVMAVLDIIYRNMVLQKKLSPALAREQLLRTEPFHNYPNLIAMLPDKPVTKD